MYRENEWHLEMCKVKETWSLIDELTNVSSEEIIIVHPDTGYTEHPELIYTDSYMTGHEGAVNFFDALPEKRPFNKAKDYLDSGGMFLNPSHGTSTASIIIGGFKPSEFDSEFLDDEMEKPSFREWYFTPNKPLLTGIAPKAKLLPIRVTDTVVLGTETYTALAKALLHIIKISEDIPQIGVVSISLGGLGNFSLVEEGLKMLRKRGIIVISAAGQAIPSFDLNPNFAHLGSLFSAN